MSRPNSADGVAMTVRIRAAILIALDATAWLRCPFRDPAALRLPAAGFEPVPPGQCWPWDWSWRSCRSDGSAAHVYSGRNRLGGYADFVTVSASAAFPALLTTLWLVVVTAAAGREHPTHRPSGSADPIC